MKIEEFDEEIVEELRSRARNALLALAITGEGGKPAQDLLEMRGMNNALAQLLASKGICTMEDLAEQATDELLDIDGIEDEEQAAKLIMIAREPWFAEAKADSEESSDDKASNV